MKISTLLLKPEIEHIRDEFILIRQALQKPNSHLFKAFSDLIINDLEQVERISLQLTEMERGIQPTPSAEVYKQFKNLKLGLRFRQRKLKRFFSNQIRLKKNQERRADASTMVA